ncbi:MAG TPA: DUF2996 domain-containing protein [Cyanobacteria bacterium UBA8543]|nr:DUF2996 domain-containing protein [Cyanobacteria bacterium UBA8543]
MSEENTPNPNAGESETPAESIENAPSSDEPQATDLPSANAPDAEAAQPKEPKPAEKKPPAKAAGDKPPAKAKKEKPPAVEDKPFNEFIEQEYVPALKKAFAKEGIEDIELSFVKDKIQIPGLSKSDACWQVAGSWKNGQRQFQVYFPGEDINKQKAFSWSTNGAKPSTLESFMIDERKVTLDLLVLYTIQRLNGQKWLSRN